METRNRSLALAFVSVFAVFSTAWGLYSLVEKSKWFEAYMCCIARGLLVVALIMVFVLLVYIFGWNRAKKKDALK